MIARTLLPAMIERGRDTAVSLDVFSDAGAQQTASAATVVFYDGGEEVIASVAATTTGPPASYTVPAATTTGRALSAEWLAVWTLTISGTDYVFQQPCYLVRRQLYPTITDTDLTRRHSDLDALRDTANMATFEPYRVAAWERIQRQLIRRGNRPALILDSFALTDLHVAETLADLFRDFGSSLGDSRYTDMAAHYAEVAKAEWGSIVFRYDEDEDGTIDQGEERRGSPAVYLTPPKWGSSGWSR